MTDAWKDYAERVEIMLDGAEAQLFNVVESFNDEQIDFLLRLIEMNDDKILWQLSGIVAAERHKRSMRVPDG